MLKLLLEVVILGWFPICCCWHALYKLLKRKEKEPELPKKLEEPKPQGCYKDPLKELERFIRTKGKPDEPFLGIDRVQTQQYLRGKNN